MSVEKGSAGVSGRVVGATVVVVVVTSLALPELHDTAMLAIVLIANAPTTILEILRIVPA